MRIVVVEIVDFQPPRSSFSGIPAIRWRTTMNIRFHSVSTALAVLLAMAGTATAATVHYDIDPEHTFPSFEADHLAGLSVWRGKFNRSSGEIALDRAAGTRSEEHTSELQSLMRTSYAVFCLQKKNTKPTTSLY